MSSRPLLSLVFVAFGLGTLGYLLFAGHEADAAPEGPVTAAVVEAAADHAPPERSRADHEAASPAAKAPEPTLEQLAKRRAEIDRKREYIRARLEHRGEDDARPAGMPEAAPEPPKLDKEYIRESVRELIPVIRDCYDNALQDDDQLGGRLVMKFEILGDEEVGGVVDHVEVDPESTIQDPDMRECMRESMYTLELPAPEAGGHVIVTYPFTFSPD